MLTPEEVEHFRTRLEHEQARLRTQLTNLDRQLAHDHADDLQADPSDAATVLLDEEEIQSQIVQTRALLTQVEKALARIAEGTYGISEVSGKPIPRERLEVLPHATTRVDEALPRR